MFDHLGGLAGLVKNKTVAIKINMTGGPRERMQHVPAEDAHYTHPAVLGVMVEMMGRAGARRIRILEGAFATSDPLEEFMIDAGWDPAPLLTAAPNVVIENTNIAGAWKSYSRFMIQGRGHLFPGFLLNKAYAESDLVVSLSKLKEHATCGITLSMKNMFGALPISIYGDHAGVEEPNEDPRGGRGIMHTGARQPSKIAPGQIAEAPRNDKFRMPRIVADIAAAVPLHLNVIDGVRTMAGGEGPWIRSVRPAAPGLLLAGVNPVCTDAVGAAVMGFDPMAKEGEKPFEKCASTLELAEAHGIGTRDLRRIEVRGLQLSEATMNFRKISGGPWA
jgi:uncharacterized protein (DUF362 family)